MTVLGARSFARYSLLRDIYIRNFTRLELIEPGAFEGLSELRVLVIVDCLNLQTIGPGVFGVFHNLDTLRINKCGLAGIPDFSSFETRSASQNSSMYEIDLSSNKIEHIKQGDFSRVKTFILLIENSFLSKIEDRAFSGATIKKLIFKNNRALSNLGKKAFSGIQGLDVLDLSRSQIKNLPTEGLINIEELVLEDTPSLKQFPSVFKFSRINTAKLTYPHHCCAFRFAAKQEREETSNSNFVEKTGACAMSTTLSPSASRTTEEMGSFIPPIRSLMKRAVNAPADWAVSVRLPLTDSFYDRDDQHPTRGGGQGGSDNAKTDNEGFKGFNVYPTLGGHKDKFGTLRPTNEKPQRTASNNWHEEPTAHNGTKWVSCGNFSSYKDYSEVVCTPRPNAFNPCEDVMGYEWLRVLVWFVLLAALCGNLVVMIVLITARSKLTVPKFLMCNLSFADFLMGLYLLLIASVDVHSLGEYFTHAVTWQNDGGCQIAGFLTVFSSELSVFVLTVITLERWYAISQAIHVNKRLRMRQATFLMLVGWIYASSMGVLPLVGISGYGAVSMCLPMEAKDVWDIVYIVSLLVFNGIAFMAICGCYISMFLKVRASENMARSNDATIAKRMAILVLTNFICWAPIAFFGLTASFGFPLIDITKSKILLVFFYPFNSCANPFLYAILTKQFRRDVFILLGRYGICTERANKYKGTSMTRSYSNSRNNGLMVNAVHNNATDVSLLSQYSKLSKGSISLNGLPSSNTSLTLKVTPQDTPQDTPCTSPKATDSPVKDASSKLSSFIFGSAAAAATAESRAGKNERKLSTVIETSHASDGPSDECATCAINSNNDDRILEGRDSLRDLFDGKPHGRVRSASEYVVIFRASSQNQQQQQQQQQMSPQQQQQQQCDSCKSVASRPGNSFERQASRDTVLSSNTLSSFLSDSSSSRVDSENELRLYDRKIFPVGSNGGGAKMCSDSRCESSEKKPTVEYVPMKARKNYSFLQDTDSPGEAESLLLNQSVVGSSNKSLEGGGDSNKYRAFSNRDSMNYIEEQSIEMIDVEVDDNIGNGFGDEEDEMEVDFELNQNYISNKANKGKSSDNRGRQREVKLTPPSCLTSHRNSSPDRRVSFCDDVKAGNGDKKKSQSESKPRLSLFKRNGKR